VRRLGLAGGLLLTVLVSGPAAANPRFHGGGGWHGSRGWHGSPGWHGGSRVFVGIGGGYVYPYPYWGSYPVYGYPYPYPPPPPWYPEPPPGPTEQEQEQPSEDASRASYGLVQLHGVPDGTSIDLDGRFWLVAEMLQVRWLALPEGEHTLTMRLDKGDPIERRVVVRAGKTHVVRFAPAS
jgi:hypothetical protein